MRLFLCCLMTFIMVFQVCGAERRVMSVTLKLPETSDQTRQQDVKTGLMCWSGSFAAAITCAGLWHVIESQGCSPFTACAQSTSFIAASDCCCKFCGACAINLCVSGSCIMCDSGDC